jgi:hypothetical protein
MGNVRTSTMYIDNQQEVVVVRTDDGIQIKHRLISDEPSKPNDFSDYLFISDEDLADFLDMIESL